MMNKITMYIAIPFSSRREAGVLVGKTKAEIIERASDISDAWQDKDEKQEFFNENWETPKKKTISYINELDLIQKVLDFVTREQEG